jgi:hypothetical protein
LQTTVHNQQQGRLHDATSSVLTGGPPPPSQESQAVDLPLAILLALFLSRRERQEKRWGGAEAAVLSRQPEHGASREYWYDPASSER